MPAARAHAIRNLIGICADVAAIRARRALGRIHVLRYYHGAALDDIGVYSKYIYSEDKNSNLVQSYAVL